MIEDLFDFLYWIERLPWFVKRWISTHEFEVVLIMVFMVFLVGYFAFLGRKIYH